MSLPEESFRELFPEKDSSLYSFSLKYSGKFSPFNANVKMQGRDIMFSLSKTWKEVGEEIKMGLLQDLLCRLFGKKTVTKEMKLYHIFTKKIHIAAERTPSDPELLRSFLRVNDRFFHGMLDMPNLVFGQKSMRTMGSYNHHTDTVRISKLLEGEDELVDYVMYHELLHKKLKFSMQGTKTLHHSKEFREREKAYPDAERLERRLVNLSRRRRWF
jgi:hypothetical protein